MRLNFSDLLRPDSALRDKVKRMALYVLEYLLGFLALAVFASLAFGHGAPTDDRFVHAFKIAGGLALIESLLLMVRSAPANRLILGANVWLATAGIAAMTEQWWVLKHYQQAGESGLFISMFVVGLVSTACSSSGFVGVHGERRRVLILSCILLLAVLLALAASVQFRGTVQWAAVLPVIALSWLHRWLKRKGQHAA